MPTVQHKIVTNDILKEARATDFKNQAYAIQAAETLRRVCMEYTEYPFYYGNIGTVTSLVPAGYLYFSSIVSQTYPELIYDNNGNERQELLQDLSIQLTFLTRVDKAGDFIQNAFLSDNILKRIQIGQQSAHFKQLWIKNSLEVNPELRVSLMNVAGVREDTTEDVIFKTGQEIYNQSHLDVILSFVEINKDKAACITPDIMPKFKLNLQVEGKVNE